MAIHFFEEDRKAGRLKRLLIKAWLNQILKMEGKKPGVINYIFCSDEYLAGVNIEFLHRDYYTDVISFDYSKADRISGDIMISIDRVRENAANMGIAYLDELRRIMAHGLLHLIGYEDNTQELKVIMTGMEDLYLEVCQDGAE